MVVELLIVLSAFLFGCSYVLAKRGMDRVDPQLVVLVSLSVNFVFLWIAYVLLPMDFSEKMSSFGSWAVVFFVLSGIFISFMTRSLSYTSIKRVGVSIAVPIMKSDPFFSALIAMMLLNEVLGVPLLIGMLSIFFGIIVLSRSDEKLVVKGKEIVLPLLSAVTLAVGNVIRKAGLNILYVPIFGAAMNVTSALCFYSLFMIAQKKTSFASIDRRSFLFICGAGVFSSAGLLFYFYALGLGKVSVVAPIMGTETLFSLLLSFIFLKNSEKVTYKILLGAVLIVLGTALIVSRG